MNLINDIGQSQSVAKTVNVLILNFYWAKIDFIGMFSWKIYVFLEVNSGKKNSCLMNLLMLFLQFEYEPVVYDVLKDVLLLGKCIFRINNKKSEQRHDFVLAFE